REHIHDLPLALVTPLGADDHDTMALRSEHESPSWQQKSPGGAGRLEHPLKECTGGTGPGQRAAEPSTDATAAATAPAPVNLSRPIRSLEVWTIRALPQLPRMTVTHSPDTGANAIPSTNTGSRRRTFALSLSRRRRLRGPGRCTNSTASPRSSRLSK